MSNTYNFLNSVWKNILTENNENRFFIPFLALFVTVPMFMGLNNVALGLFVITLIFYRKQLKFQFSASLLLPIALFLWMCASYIWSIDAPQTLQAIPKEIALFIVPVIFLLIPKFSSEQQKKLLAFYSYAMVFFVLVFKISVTPKKRGVSPSIIEEFGEIETSQSVNAYKASKVLSGETPGVK